METLFHLQYGQAPRSKPLRSSYGIRTVRMPTSVTISALQPHGLFHAANVMVTRPSWYPVFFTTIWCFPAASVTTDGVFPTNSPSHVRYRSSAHSPPRSPSQLKRPLPQLVNHNRNSWRLAEEPPRQLLPPSDSARMRRIQCAVIAPHASCTEPPTESVDFEKIPSPLVRTNTATLSLCRSTPLPPSWSSSTTYHPPSRHDC